MEKQKLTKLILIIFLVWLGVTYVPNNLLHKWWFVVLIFANFYLVSWRLKQRKNHDLFMNTVIYGLVIFDVASLILNRLGF